MKTVEITLPVEYIDGYLRDGGFTGKIALSNEDFDKFIDNPEETFKSLNLMKYMNFEIWDYELNARGELDFSEMEYRIIDVL